MSSVSSHVVMSKVSFYVMSSVSSHVVLCLKYRFMICLLYRLELRLMCYVLRYVRCVMSHFASSPVRRAPWAKASLLPFAFVDARNSPSQIRLRRTPFGATKVKTPDCDLRADCDGGTEETGPISP